MNNLDNLFYKFYHYYNFQIRLNDGVPDIPTTERYEGNVDLVTTIGKGQIPSSPASIRWSVLKMSSTQLTSLLVLISLSQRYHQQLTSATKQDLGLKYIPHNENSIH